MAVANTIKYSDSGKKMFKGFIERASAAINDQKGAAQAFVDKHWDDVESTLVSLLMKVAEDHLTYDKHTTALFEAAHGMLPLPLRLGIRQGTFVEYCHSHKSTILQKIQARKASQGPDGSLIPGLDQPTDAG